jgi:hypothetical protein
MSTLATGMFSTTCFAHRDAASTGACALCGRSWCEQCFEPGHQAYDDFICRECFAEALQRVQRRMRIGWIVAAVPLAIGALAVAAVIVRLLVAGPPENGSFSELGASLLSVPLAAYYFWAGYWGVLATWLYLKNTISLLLIMVIVVFGIAPVLAFGVLGGGVYAYLKHRRFARGTKANAALALKLGLSKV